MSSTQQSNTRGWVGVCVCVCERERESVMWCDVTFHTICSMLKNFWRVDLTTAVNPSHTYFATEETLRSHSHQQHITLILKHFHSWLSTRLLQHHHLHLFIKIIFTVQSRIVHSLYLSSSWPYSTVCLN